MWVGSTSVTASCMLVICGGDLVCGVALAFAGVGLGLAFGVCCLRLAGLAVAWLLLLGLRVAGLLGWVVGLKLCVGLLL